MPYPTPDKPSQVRLVCRRIFVPDQIDIISVLFGQYAEMCRDDYWIESGDWTVEDLTQWLRQGLLQSQQNEDCFMLCSVQWTVAAIIPDGWLLADGSIVDSDDYPDYAASCDSSLVVSPSQVRLPDLVDRMPVGAGNVYTVNDTGGETDHTLTAAEMPAHTHSETSYTFNIDVESAGVPDPSAIGLPTIPSQTGSAGGGGSHNNMPPYYGIKPIVKVLP